jgi:hypothetical protein
MHKKNSKRIIFTAAAAALLAAGCADQRPPTGGPVDLTPPEIVETFPQNKTTLFHDRSIILKFSKNVDQRSVQESMFISPYAGQPDYDWSGKEVEVRFPEPLHDSTTYVVNVGTDVVDLHNKNRMAHAFTLAFSTGNTIDSAAIEGIVLPSYEKESPSGIMVFAYRLRGINAAMLNPRKQRPDFITQTGIRGDFSLHHIPVGLYRVMAVKDENRNFLYDPESEEYGLSTSDIRLTPEDTLCSGLVMQLAKEDTTSPRLMKVTALDERRLIAEFSKAVVPESYTDNSFSIFDTLTHAPLKIYAAYANFEKLSDVNLITAIQDSTKAYRLFVRSACDSAGNRINILANSMTFSGSPKPDSAVFKVTSFPMKDSSIAVQLEGPFLFHFSDAVDTLSAEQNLQLLNAVKENIPVEWKWLSADAAALSPEQKLQSMAWYELRGEFRAFKNWEGRNCKDSTKEIRFQTLDEYDLSSIEGMVAGGADADTAGEYVVTAFRIGGGAAKVSTAVADARGYFSIQGLEQGRYVLQAYRDKNRNHKFDPGRPFPFIPAEPISAFSDTLRVRARWPLEGVKLKFHR